MRTRWGALLVVIGLAGVSACRDGSTSPGSAGPDPASVRASAIANAYVADFVATAASGAWMNDAGDVVGTSYPDPGCGPFCLPPQENVVWRGGNRIVLPAIPAFTPVTLRMINNQGWVTGTGGYSTTHALVWIPNGTTYSITDIGTLPGMTSSEATGGIDNQNRVVGWSSKGGAIPTAAGPFLWTQAGGMVNLATLGFPSEKPLAVSPGGTVATPGFWYRLLNAASVTPMPAPPQGFYPPGTYPTAINDAGDQGRFLVTTSSQSLVYPFRFTAGNGWQQISTLPTGNLSSYGMGSINSALDITLTAQSTGLVAPGPNGLAQSLTPRLSPAYGNPAVTSAGPINSSGQILAKIMIGRSSRLVRLTPASPCGSNCIRISAIQMQGKFVQDPARPGQCFPNGIMFNRVTARVTAVSETGAPLANVRVNARFLDDYWTNRTVSGTTNASGVVTFTNKGPCGVGAVAILVDQATLGTRTFDRTTGVVQNWVIPK